MDDKVALEEIKNNAPDGATHYAVRQDGVVYFINVNDLYVLMDGSLRFNKPCDTIKPLP